MSSDVLLTIARTGALRRGRKRTSAPAFFSRRMPSRKKSAARPPG